jgi:hypothetical protein
LTTATSPGSVQIKNSSILFLEALFLPQGKSTHVFSVAAGTFRQPKDGHQGLPDNPNDAQVDQYEQASSLAHAESDLFGCPVARLRRV